MAELAAPEEFVFGVVRDDELVLIPIGLAHELAMLWPALTGSKTWGELRSRISPDAYAGILERIAWSTDDEEDEERDTQPQADTPFEPGDIDGYNDGDWPTYPPRHMADWLPDGLMNQYAQFEDGADGGLYISIDPAHTWAIVAALEASGHRCTEDAELVRRAIGD